MKTMPRPVLGLMRFAVFVMLAVVSRWEDRHADQGDHRMAALNSGLWRAEQSLRQIVSGDFSPVPPPPRPRPTAGVAPKRMSLADRELRERVSGVPVPARSVD